MFTALGTLYLLSALVLARQMNKTQVCLHMAKVLAGPGASQTSISGYQNALTDPKENPIFFISGLIWLATVGGYFYLFGAWIGALSLVGIVIVLAAGRMLLFTKEDSPKWIPIVHGSLCRREADYAKANDILRQSATKSLREEFESVFHDEFSSLLGETKSGS